MRLVLEGRLPSSGGAALGARLFAGPGLAARGAVAWSSPENRRGARAQRAPGVHRVAPGHLPTPRTSPQVLFPATRMLNVTKSVGNLARWPLPCVSIPVMSPQPGEEVYRLRLSSAALLSLPQSKHNKIRFFLVLCSSSRALRLRAALAWSAALARGPWRWHPGRRSLCQSDRPSRQSCGLHPWVSPVCFWPRLLGKAPLPAAPLGSSMTWPQPLSQLVS